MRGEARLARIEHALERPLMALALLMLPAIAVPAIAGGPLPDPLGPLLNVLELSTWAIFASAFALKVAVAPHRWAYVRSHPIELLIVALPFLRPLRFLRVLAAVGLNVAMVARFFEQRGMRLLIAGLAATLLIGSLFVWAVEQHAPGDHAGRIETPAEALWWGFITMTTVGYGDHSPTTDSGRIITVAITLVGIVGVSILSGAVAAFLVRENPAEDVGEVHVRAGNMWR